MDIKNLDRAIESRDKLDKYKNYLSRVDECGINSISLNYSELLFTPYDILNNEDMDSIKIVLMDILTSYIEIEENELCSLGVEINKGE